MLGGVTSTQGITLANAGAFTRFFKGLVRNVESPGDPELESAGTNVANPEPGGAQAYLTNKLLGRQGAYLQHLSEGKGPTARLVPEPADRSAALGDHERALRHPLGRSAARGLPGHGRRRRIDGLVAAEQPAPVRRHRRHQGRQGEQIPMALGSDWPPSGTKNLLGELKVA
jgi:5-methylthioadenosine/S-adenosylhomocysteine deaminase